MVDEKYLREYESIHGKTLADKMRQLLELREQQPEPQTKEEIEAEESMPLMSMEDLQLKYADKQIKAQKQRILDKVEQQLNKLDAIDTYFAELSQQEKDFIIGTQILIGLLVEGGKDEFHVAKCVIELTLTGKDSIIRKVHYYDINGQEVYCEKTAPNKVRWVRTIGELSQ